MNAILDKARQHFASMARQNIEVPEWGGEDGPMRVYFDALSLAARQNIETRSKGSASARLSLTVILHALDADGKKLFVDDAVTRRAFDREIDPAVIARLAGAMLGVSEETDLGE